MLTSSSNLPVHFSGEGGLPEKAAPLVGHAGGHHDKGSGGANHHHAPPRRRRPASGAARRRLTDGESSCDADDEADRPPTNEPTEAGSDSGSNENTSLSPLQPTNGTFAMPTHPDGEDTAHSDSKETRRAWDKDSKAPLPPIELPHYSGDGADAGLRRSSTSSSGPTPVSGSMHGKERRFTSSPEHQPIGGCEDIALEATLRARSEALRTKLQQFGCCVFFFPTPIVSWLFPLTGHVGISNAEGTRLYTFESSYFVREERLSEVLDRVLKADGWPESAPAAGGSCPRGPLSSPSAPLESSTASVGTSPFTLSPGQEPASPPPADPLRGRWRLPQRRGGGSPSGGSPAYPGSPSPRRYPKPSHSSANSGHLHTKCVRIWDLKPLLMESRGLRKTRLPFAATVSSLSPSSRTATVLLKRLHELLQAESRGEWSDRDVRYGVSSGEEDDRYELLDPDTARFFNRNLLATAKIFRGSPDGTTNSPDTAILKHYNSFSFVGFVLEACGVGGHMKVRAPPSTGTSAPPSSTSTTAVVNGKASAAASAAPTTASSATPPAGGGDGATAITDDPEENEFEEGIQWGMSKILINLTLFGEWYRSGRRVLRAVHGGSIASAVILWILLLIPLFWNVIAQFVNHRTA